MQYSCCFFYCYNLQWNQALVLNLHQDHLLCFIQCSIVPYICQLVFWSLWYNRYLWQLSGCTCHLPPYFVSVMLSIFVFHSTCIYFSQLQLSKSLQLAVHQLSDTYFIYIIFLKIVAASNFTEGLTRRMREEEIGFLFFVISQFQTILLPILAPQ